MNEPVIVEAIRLPFGRRGGYYREIRPDSLLAHALRGLVDRAGIADTAVEDVIVGCVTQAGEQAANVGRLATLLAGFPPAVPGTTLDRMCGSSQQAIHFAAQAIAAGDMAYVVAGGVENMTRVPMFSSIGGGGFEKLNPALHERYDLIHQGESAERLAEKWGVSRQALDDFAAESHRRAAQAAGDGRHTELLSITALDRDGRSHTPTHDEGIRFALDRARMGDLAPAFRAAGTGVVTAANSSQLADGAAAVLLADKARALADGLRRAFPKS
jgi:acetyl-CoA acyltransferase